MTDSESLDLSLNQVSFPEHGSNLIFLEDYVQPNDFEKPYVVVVPNLISSNGSLFDVVVGTTNLFSKTFYSPYFIPVVSSEEIEGELHRITVYEKYNLYSLFVFSKSNLQNYPDIYRIDDYGFFNRKMDFLVRSLDDLHLTKQDLKPIESILKQYSS